MATMALGTPIGVHLLLNVYDIPNQHLLQYMSRGLPILEELVRELDLHVVSRTGHQFHPMGYTHAHVLSESHFTIHTYPEHRSCYIDIFCCSDSFDPLFAIQRIKTRFHTENVRYHIISR
jgi:S-adenosylmethionine decarboxylase proenzyme